MVAYSIKMIKSIMISLHKMLGSLNFDLNNHYKKALDVQMLVWKQKLAFDKVFFLFLIQMIAYCFVVA